MTAYFDGARLRQFQEAHLKLKDFWAWYLEHYGFVWLHLAPLGTLFPLWVIWSYLEKIESRELFVQSLHDVSVLPIVVFSSVFFIFATVMLFVPGVTLALLVGNAWRSQSGWIKVVEVVLLGGMAVVVSAYMAILFVGETQDYRLCLTVWVLYWAIIILPVLHLLNIKPSRHRWFPWVFSILVFLVFLSVAGKVSERVVHFAGISQKVSSKQYYSVDKRYVHHFQNVGKWELVVDGERIYVRGYKLFQLSDVTVLCPAISDAEEVKVKQCARISSAGLMAMPEDYTPVSKKAESGEAGKKEKISTAKK